MYNQHVIDRLSACISIALTHRDIEIDAQYDFIAPEDGWEDELHHYCELQQTPPQYQAECDDIIDFGEQS